jgi:hypothetical protein
MTLARFSLVVSVGFASGLVAFLVAFSAGDSAAWVCAIGIPATAMALVGQRGIDYVWMTLCGVLVAAAMVLLAASGYSS